MNNSEFQYKGTIANGFLVVALQIIVGMLIAYMVLTQSVPLFCLGVLLGIVELITFKGYITLEPNQVCVLMFMGKYKGTFGNAGFYWVNPFFGQQKISLRIRNSDIAPIKVNDKMGNPILIGMVLVWQLRDTYKALFDLDSSQSLSNFVSIQSDAALREVAGQYAYDNDDQDITLRSGGHEINIELVQKLNDRLGIAGIHVVEARINYLAYAPEIAAAMLRRQQAAAIIAAREKIVEGAVSMVKMALDNLENQQVVNLDNDHRAKMVGNLLLVLCADDAAQPVIPAGN